jgi:hypothetical protein
MKKYVFTILRTILISFSLVAFAVVTLWAVPARPGTPRELVRFLTVNR